MQSVVTSTSESCTQRLENEEVLLLRCRSLKHDLQANSCGGSRPAQVCTYVLLVMLTLGGHGLLWSAVAMLRAATQAVGHAVHLLERLEPEEEEDKARVSEIINYFCFLHRCAE